MVQSDVTEKIASTRQILAGKLQDGLTFEQLVELEKEVIPKSSKSNPCATRQILRLLRALEFMALFCELVAKSDGAANLRHDLKEAYAATLSHHHTFFVRQAVGAAALTLGTKAVFLAQVAGSEQQGQAAIEKIPSAIEPTVKEMHKVLQENGIKDIN
jgi:hypothetical protein